MSKNKNVMIKTVANSPLLLCESATNVGNNKYRFRGVFTACSDEKHTVINRNNRIAPFEEQITHNKLNISKEYREMSQMVLNNLTRSQSVYDYLNILESLSLSLLCSSKQKQRVYSYCMAICSNKDKYFLVFMRLLN